MTSRAGPSEAVRYGGGRRTKNLKGEIRKKEEKGGKKEKRGERKERGEKGKKGRGEQVERCIRPMGVKHPLRTVKRYKTHETRGAENLNKQEERKKRQKWPEKTW